MCAQDGNGNFVTVVTRVQVNIQQWRIKIFEVHSFEALPRAFRPSQPVFEQNK